MFNHTSCAYCSMLNANAKALLNGPQTVAIGQVSPETLRAQDMRREAWAHEDEAYREYRATYEAELTLWEDDLRAKGYTPFWYDEEQEYMWAAPK